MQVEKQVIRSDCLLKFKESVLFSNKVYSNKGNLFIIVYNIYADDICNISFRFK